MQLWPRAAQLGRISLPSPEVEQYYMAMADYSAYSSLQVDSKVKLTACPTIWQPHDAD